MMSDIYMVSIRDLPRRAVYAEDSIEAVRAVFAESAGVPPAQVRGLSLSGGNANSRWQFSVQGGGRELVVTPSRVAKKARDEAALMRFNGQPELFA